MSLVHCAEQLVSDDVGLACLKRALDLCLGGADVGGVNTPMLQLTSDVHIDQTLTGIRFSASTRWLSSASSNTRLSHLPCVCAGGANPSDSHLSGDGSVDQNSVLELHESLVFTSGEQHAVAAGVSPSGVTASFRCVCVCCLCCVCV